MAQANGRRAFLKQATLGAAIVGFDMASRSWVSAAAAAERADAIPHLDGELLTDAASLAAVAEDYGHIVTRTPQAVLRPGSVQDIVKMVKFARRHHIAVAARGQGHSTYGQPLVDAGFVIDMSTLSQICSIRPAYAVVEGGVRWIDLFQVTLAQGRIPPVATDYIDLSVGGTLSVGGIGGASHKHGVQIDNVLELLVVTGEGKLVSCTPTRSAALFNAVLGGLGQFGIIVRATVKLAAAKASARTYLLYYDDIALFTADQQALIGDGRFDYVEGQIVAKAGGGWQYMIEAASFYSAPSTPNDTALLAGLGFNPGSQTIADVTYFDFLNRLAPTVAFLKSIGAWSLPHPWYDVFVPASQVNAYVGGIVARLTEADTGQGPVLIYPVKRSKFTKPFFRVPNEEVVFLFDILRTAATPEIAQQMVAANRALYEQVRAVGGTRYAIGAIPLTQADWAQHFGAAWPQFQQAKAKFDPDHILSPGQGIF